jgi:hypothetical protein
VAASALNEPSGTPVWKTTPSWYLVGTADRVIPPAEQRFMAKRAGSTIVELRASHLPMVSRPAAVTRLILEAARLRSSARERPRAPSPTATRRRAAALRACLATSRARRTAHGVAGACRRFN